MNENRINIIVWGSQVVYDEPMPEKSYFDCIVKRVRPRNTPKVIRL